MPLLWWIASAGIASVTGTVPDWLLWLITAVSSKIRALISIRYNRCGKISIGIRWFELQVKMTVEDLICVWACGKFRFVVTVLNPGVTDVYTFLYIIKRDSESTIAEYLTVLRIEFDDREIYLGWKSEPVFEASLQNFGWRGTLCVLISPLSCSPTWSAGHSGRYDNVI